MATSGGGFWNRHGATIVLLGLAFTIGFLVRTIFSLGLLNQFGPLFLYGGGSDSFYHSRVMEWIIQNHVNLGRDLALRYPTGAVNPREPLFDWMNAVFGILFAGFFGGNAVTAGAFSLDLQAPLWSALGVVPVYLIGKEVTSRRVGLVAAFIYPLLPANIDSSVFGYANYLSFYTFFILVLIFCYLKTVRAAGTRRWVESYRHPRSIAAGLRAFLRTERSAVKWAVFSGVALGTLALAWQGYSFAIAAIVVFLVFAMVVERIRRVDSFGLYVVTAIVGLVGFPMAIPYYLPQGLFAGWFDLPLLVFFGALAILLPFLLLRDVPYVFSLPILGAIAAAAIGLLAVVNQAFFFDIVTGQGYFVKTLVYSTVAEAQAPSIDALILGYGVFTFFIAFVGFVLILLRLARGRFPRVLMFFSVFALISIYLPISAAKFFFLGSAAFALLAAEAIIRLIDVAGYPQLRRNVASLSDRRSQFGAFRRSLKARHILVLALVTWIVAWNVWYAVDAGVPYNVKSGYNLQIYNTLPPPLRTSPSNASSFYLGAAGTQLDTPTQYDENGYDWLATQDVNVPPPQRPAFVSWWDYGFQAVAEGQHPTVADNFQNGIVPAGNFLLTQNESQAIANLATTLLAAEQTESGKPYLPAGLNTVLARDGVNLTTLHSLMTNLSQDKQLVLAHPERYLAVDASHLDGPNSMYLTMQWFLATSLPVSGVAQVYDDVQAYTHWSIRYAMVDTRLFPFSGQNTGIFYAPADLTDRVIGSGGAPTAFYTLSVLGSDGNTYPVGGLPAGVTATNYNINYLPAFYDSMIYHIFIGYNGTQIGLSGGIPGISGAAGGYPVEPGWMLQHFEVVYRTAYYCPTPSSVSNPNCPIPANLPAAAALAKKTNGSAYTDSNHYFQGGETFLAYYSGQPVTGAVRLPDGTPVANARLTVYDGWNIPHETVVTGANGAYTIDLPPGNDTVNVTTGPLSPLPMAGTTHLLTLHIPVSNANGFALAGPTVVRPITLAPGTVQGYVYWNVANNTTFQPARDPVVPGATAVLWGHGYPTMTRVADASGAYDFANVPPGVYNFSVLVGSSNFSERPQYVTAGNVSNATTALPPGSVVGFVRLPGGGFAANASVTVSGPKGVVARTSTAAGGNFTIPNLPPGNFSLQASLPALRLGSSAYDVIVGLSGGRSHLNVTLVPTETLDLTVIANGGPAAAFPVRFTPILPPPSAKTTTPTTGGTGPGGTTTTGSGSPATPAVANSTAYLTDGSGEVHAVLPLGNYSVYGYGLIGSTWYAGFASEYVGGAAPIVALAPLEVRPAVPLGGGILLPTGPPGPLNSPTEITAYSAHGDQVTAYSNSSGAWSLPLPAGNYTLEATEGAIGGSAGLSAALTTVDLTAPTHFVLTLVPGTPVRFIVAAVGATTPGPVAPTPNAEVAVTLAPSGARITALTNSSGNVTLVVPGSVPTGASYCLNVTAFGFAPYGLCGLSPPSLGATTSVPLTVHAVPVHLAVVGLPAKAKLTLNLTAVAGLASSQNATGGTSFDLSVRPGEYTINAYAPTPNGTGLYLPPAVRNVSIPLGSQQTNITLVVLHQVAGKGSLVLPSGVTASEVAVHLLSPALNLSVSGSAFSTRFFLAPAQYTVYAAATGGNASYAILTTISFNATGVANAPVVLTSRGATIVANLTLPNGAPLNATVAVNLTASGTLTIPTTAFGGRVTAVLPVNETFVPSLATTQFIPNGTGGLFERLVVAPGTACVARLPSAFCTIRLVGTALVANLSGTLGIGGYPSPVPGTVSFQGPAPSVGVTTVTSANGSFAAELLPGVYSVYATADIGGAAFANATSVDVPATGAAPLGLVLGGTWTDTVTVVAPPGTDPLIARLTLTAPGGSVLVYPSVAVNSSVAFALPRGVWTLAASATVAPFGVRSNATASVAVPLLAGNAATRLDLKVVFSHSVALAVAPPTSVAIGNGGTATFSIAVRNTGNAPVAVHFLGSPSYWNISFAPENVSLGLAAGNVTRAVEVTIVVPPNTGVAHPAIALEALLPDGTVAGVANPEPSVSVAPRFAIAAGAPPSTPPTVGPLSASVPFYVANHGNVPATVAISVADAARLSALGWKAGINVANAPLTANPTLAPSGNESYSVHLTAPAGHALPPGTVSVAVRTNASTGGTLTIVLSVPAIAVAVNGSSVTVTGPGLGSPPAYPDWLVPLLAFAPAIALVTTIAAVRWWRTRRWKRR